jgi:AraC-like DNA-binding protein
MLSAQALRRLCRARDRLREAPDRPVHIADIAREAGLSRFHFIRLFESVFGVTPHQYRIGARVDRAKDLLASGSYSVTDACMEVGFSSLGSFSGLFSRRVGIPPSAYRRRIRSVGAPRIARAPGCLSLMAAAFALFEKHSPAALSHSTHAHQDDERHGRRPEQGPGLLHADLRLREEA